MNDFKHLTAVDARQLGRRSVAPKPSKYRNVKTTVDGIVFDSAKEARRWQELTALEKSGAIHRLKRQHAILLLVHAKDAPGFPLQRIGDYIADFVYCTCAKPAACDGSLGVVEDVKSPATKTPLYRWKRKHVEVQYGITIREI